MPHPVDWVRLDSLALSTGSGLPRGRVGRDSASAETGLRVILPRRVATGDLDGGSALYLPDEATLGHRSAVAAAGDLVFARVGEAFAAALVPSTLGERYVMVDATSFRVSCDTALVDPRFLLLWLRTTTGQQSLRAVVASVFTGGSFRPARLRAAFGSMTVPLPPRTTQEAIVAAVDALDKRLRADRDLIAAEDKRLMALFEATFDQGSAVGSCQPVLDLPTGWHAGTLGDEVRVLRGWRPRHGSPEAGDDGLRWVWPGDLPPAGEPWLLTTARRVASGPPQQLCMPPGVTVLGAVGHRCGDVALAAVSAVMSVHCLALRHRSDRHAYTYYLARHLAPWWAALIHDVWPHRHLAASMVEDQRMALPPMALMDAFEDEAWPALVRVLDLQRRCQATEQEREEAVCRMLAGGAE